MDDDRQSQPLGLVELPGKRFTLDLGFRITAPGEVETDLADGDRRARSPDFH